MSLEETGVQWRSKDWVGGEGNSPARKNIRESDLAWSGAQSLAKAVMFILRVPAMEKRG